MAEKQNNYGVKC